ncbi:hypothetical protein V6N12_031045 [Hibiscus sabdariffa]|uniref:RNase H type-1 domain-containing protein n=1 Tax=Hibiscus sabdariffa TaxID=183260 RepID=A0ABR2E7R3_9ROSI
MVLNTIGFNGGVQVMVPFNKSLKFLLGTNLSSNVIWEKFVWLGFAPPKVEIFRWSVIWGRVPVKSWMFFYCMLGVSCNLPVGSTKLLEAWGGICGANGKQWWLFIPFAVIWTVWLFRNEIVFKGKEVYLLQILYLVKYRLVIWIKAKFLDACISLDNLIVEPPLAIKICKKALKSKIIPRWLPPPMGFLKLNVDGRVAAGAFNCGMGGLLRNDKGVILFHFSDLLIVKMDCKLVVDWISLSVDSPPNFFNLVSELSDMVIKRGFVMRLTPRSCNVEAGRLAKAGIG